MHNTRDNLKNIKPTDSIVRDIILCNYDKKTLKKLLGDLADYI